VTRLRWAALFSWLVCALLVGCGGAGGAGSDSGNTASTASAAAAESAAQAVRAYYSAIDNGDFGQAWQYLGSQQRREDAGYHEFKSGQESTTQTLLLHANPAAVSGDTVRVRVGVKSIDEHSCDDRIRRTFTGFWTVDVGSTAPVLSSANISQVGSDQQLPSTCPTDSDGDGVSDTQDNCPDTPNADQADSEGNGVGDACESPPPPARQNCTPGYSPCIPPGSDVDCASGGGNGPRYVPGPVTVTGSDPYGLDANGNGIGCE
jgi:hypothetical protein